MGRSRVPRDAQQGATDEGEGERAGEVVERGRPDAWLLFRGAHTFAGWRRAVKRGPPSSSLPLVVARA